VKTRAEFIARLEASVASTRRLIEYLDIEGELTQDWHKRLEQDIALELVHIEKLREKDRRQADKLRRRT
jgi:hypothetical protein